MMKITGLSHLFKWENLHNWWLTKYFFAPLYIGIRQALMTVHMGTVISYTSKLLQQRWKYNFYKIQFLSKLIIFPSSLSQFVSAFFSSKEGVPVLLSI